MKVPIKQLLIIFSFFLAQNSVAEELEKTFKYTNIFTSPEQREQLDVQRRRLELGKLVDDLPNKVEQIKKKKKVIKILPKIVYKGMIQKKGKQPIYWIEGDNNLQGVNQFQNNITVIGINKDSIKFNYKDSLGIKLKPSQTFVPVERKIYEGFDFVEVQKPIATETAKETKNKVRTKSSNDEDALTRQLGIFGKLQKVQELLK